MSLQDTGSTSLPAAYASADAVQDRRDLATLEAPDVAWRVKRRLRHRVGDEDELRARLAAWDASLPVAPAPPRQVLMIAHGDAIALAREYVDVCRYVWGEDHPDVLANADRIARGDVLPWDARHVIEGERERAEDFRRQSAQIAAFNTARREVEASRAESVTSDVSV